MTNFFGSSILFTAILAWFVAQVLKVIIVLIHDKKLDFYRLIGSGGMPSSHSAFVVSLATGVGIKDGIDSTAFAIAFVLAFVVMYDAAGVRRAAGEQAKILNQIVEKWETDDLETKGEKLKELLGHTPLEVFGGTLLGILVAFIRHM